MALIECPECGKEISDQAKMCVHCGFALQKVEEQPKVVVQEKSEAELREEAKKTYEKELLKELTALKDKWKKKEKTGHIINGVFAAIIFLILLPNIILLNIPSYTFILVGLLLIIQEAIGIGIEIVLYTEKMGDIAKVPKEKYVYYLKSKHLCERSDNKSLTEKLKAVVTWGEFKDTYVNDIIANILGKITVVLLGIWCFLLAGGSGDVTDMLEQEIFGRLLIFTILLIVSFIAVMAYGITSMLVADKKLERWIEKQEIKKDSL